MNGFVQELAKAEEDERRIEQIRQEISSDAQALTELSPEMEALRQRIREVDARILDAGGDDYKRMKEQVEKAV